jgi:hypothetical protein
MAPACSARNPSVRVRLRPFQTRCGIIALSTQLLPMIHVSFLWRSVQVPHALGLAEERKPRMTARYIRRSARINGTCEARGLPDPVGSCGLCGHRISPLGRQRHTKDQRLIAGAAGPADEPRLQVRKARNLNRFDVSLQPAERYVRARLPCFEHRAATAIIGADRRAGPSRARRRDGTRDRAAGRSATGPADRPRRHSGGIAPAQRPPGRGRSRDRHAPTPRRRAQAARQRPTNRYRPPVS